MHSDEDPPSLEQVTHDPSEDEKPAAQPELPRELVRLEGRGLLPRLSPPQQGVPVFDPDPEEYLAGPPEESGLVVAGGAPGAQPGGWSLMLATALRGAPTAQEALVEDAFVRRSNAAMSGLEHERRRPIADQVALLEVDYLSACNKYLDAEKDAPRPADWKNPQHLLEAMKVHERRMDRLQRGVRDAHERWVRAIELLDRPAAVPSAQPSGGALVGVGVEVTQTGAGTSRVRVGAK